MAVDVGTLLMKFEADDKKLQKSFTKISKGLVNIGKIGTTALLAIGGASLKTAADFEKGMDKVKAITDSTDEQMQKLEQTAKDLGASTAFSAKEAAEGMAFLGMAGFDTNEIIAAMPGLLDLAAASATDLALTADIVSDAMSAFKLETDQTGRFADVLAKAASSANVTVMTLGESFKFAAPIAGAMSFSVENVTAALGVMGDKSIKASMAGTTLRTAMTKIATAASDSNSELSKLAGGLVNADDTMKDFDDIIIGLQDSFSKMSEAQKASTAETLFGRNAVSGMLALLDDSEGAYKNLVDELNNAEGAAKKMADTMLDNLAGQMTLLKSATEGIAIEIGQILIPIFVKFAKFISDNMPKIKKFFVKTFEAIVKSSKKVWKFIDRNILPIFKKLKSFWDRNGRSIASDAKGAFDGIVKAGETMWIFFKENILPIIERVFKFIVDNYPEMKKTAVIVFDGIVAAASALWSVLEVTLIPILGALVDFIENNFPAIQATIEAVFAVITTVFTGVHDYIQDNLIPVYERLFKTTEEGMPKMEEDTKKSFGIMEELLRLNANLTDLFYLALDSLLQLIYNFSQSKLADNLFKVMKEDAEFVLGVVDALITSLTTVIRLMNEAFEGDIGTGTSGSFLGGTVPEILDSIKPQSGGPGMNTPRNGNSSINININGPISSTRDADRTANRIVSRLKAAGVRT